MISKMYRTLFGVKRRQRLALVPRKLANTFDHRLSSYQTSRVFRKTAARDPVGVRHLMHANHVDTEQELADLLPWPHYRPRPLQRLKRWLQRLEGSTDYEPVVRPYFKRLNKRGTER